MSGFEKTITAAIVGACIALISTLWNNAKLKKTLNQCAAEPDSADTFEYKGATYSKSKYVEIAVPRYQRTAKSDLERMIKSYRKSYEKGKLSEIQILDMQAMETVMNNK